MTARLVCEWGINDSPVGYIVHDCPFYKTWQHMLGRRLNRNDDPTRRDVTVCEEWKSFWTFKEWAETKDWEGIEGKKELDKDIRIPGNKGYRPDACLVVDHYINCLQLIDPRKYIGDYAQGVFLSERKTMPDKYVAAIKIDGKIKRLGTFLTVAAASSDYCKKKAEYLRELAEKQEPKETILKEALLRWADIYELEVVYLRDRSVV
jgi:hypothetical protein